MRTLTLSLPKSDDEHGLVMMPSREIYVSVDGSGRCVIPLIDREKLRIRSGSMITLQIIEVDEVRT